MPEDLTLRVFRARLNYKDVETYTNWNNLMINDYLGITEGTLALADQIDSNTLQISINTQAIEELGELSAGQQVKIYSLSGRIGNAVKQININTEQISTNSDNIEQNSLDINDLQELVNRI